MAPAIVRAYTLDRSTSTAATDGSREDVRRAIAAVSDGWTVTLPPGSFVWSSGIDMSGKAIHLQGAGSGRIVGRSKSRMIIGTGLKMLTTEGVLSLTPGEKIRLVDTTNGDNFMDATVTHYVGTRLVIDVGGSGGGGAPALWVIATDPKTVVTNAADDALIAVAEHDTGNIEISDLTFRLAAGAGADAHVRIEHANHGRPVLIHDCWFSGTGDFKSIVVESNRGMVWNCSFDASFDSSFPGGGSTDTQAIGLKWQGGGASWAAPSTMGVADSDGTGNFYVEDCDFHGMFLQGLDLDDNSRTVIRHNVFDNSAITAHGQDTSAFGARHWEIYDNTFLFDDLGAVTFNLANGYFYGRGGTGVIADNRFDDIKSVQWGNPAEITLTVQQLRRDAGPSGCWRAGPPAPRQIGYGYVTGAGRTGAGGYQGDLEPVYFWNNSGLDIARVDYQPDECGNHQTVTDYIRPHVEYFQDLVKPGYTKSSYPHPLRNASTSAASRRGRKAP